MNTLGNKFNIFWIGLIFSLACSRTAPEPIEFSISQGVLNNMDFTSLGIQTGQHLPEILYYTLTGEKFEIEANTTKLLISGSYTCDITRGNLQAIDWLYMKYKDEVDIYLVNTLEAHPHNSHSPYSMNEEPWLVKENIASAIAAEQPTTIEERIDLAEKWIKESGIQAPLILDGPKNGFWNLMGQAPNMAILVSTDGEVLLKQSWFEMEEMEEAIDNQLQQMKADK
ncbi:hypothetical protein [Algoriphagus aquimarinus]|uniref:Uncharacterized protein n=1 Tax=Algoriphagus aquimarinus TaxID=237018 RepID=A0A1I0WVJ6_9BACT|nr:hypothetical protein [Algoriphagus aquimarinus]SFA92671.1 hypothetical protein SAMN04489723_102344 [Algoriphagus aquimarinus]